MACADFTFYKAIYRGDAIQENDFDRLITRAESYLKSVVLKSPPRDLFKMAACAVAEAWQINEQGGEVSSQSVGSWSKSFVTSSKTPKQRLYAAADIYIGDYISSVRWC